MATEGIRLGGRRLGGRYVLNEEIAAGPTGTVWRAHDEVLGRSVAVKVLHERLARDPAAVERFRAEAVAAARLSHPAIARVFDTGIEDTTCFIVTELRSTSTLRGAAGAAKVLPPAEAGRIVLSVLQGLAHAHRQGVIHRDLKPDNVLVDPDGTVKVTDFGVASAVAASRDPTTAAEMLERVPYVAPEEIEGGDVDARADIYAAGAILYELLTGSVPVAGDPDPTPGAIPVHLDVVPPGELRSGIPDSVAGVAMRALAHDPSDRFQNAEDMALALAPAVPPPAMATRAPAPAHEPSEDGRSFFRTWMAAPLLLLVATGLAAGGVLVFGEVQGTDVPAGEPLEIVTITDHDPQGDNEENGATVGSAIDGDVNTAWSTEGYESADLSGLKEGVGILVDLGSPRDVGGIDLRTPLPGWRFELYGGDDPDSVDDPLLSTDGSTSFEAQTETPLELEPARHRYVRVWVTELAAASDGRYRAEIGEVDLLPPSG